MVQGRCMQRAHKKENDIRFQGPKKRAPGGQMPLLNALIILGPCPVSTYLHALR